MASVRILWPFMRVLPNFGPEIELLVAAGIEPLIVADADARLPRLLIGEMIWSAIQRTGNSALGVHAGEKVESADFGVMDNAVHACANFREAAVCLGRYTRLMDDNIDMRLVDEHDGTAIWQVRNAAPSILDATNDFQVTVSVTNLRRLGMREPPLEVHLRHRRAFNAPDYARVFGCPVRLGMEHNGLLISRAFLDRPLPAANPHVFSVFDRTATRKVAQLARTDKVSERVRRLVVHRLGRESISIVDISTLLHMSEATLRRRLDEEGTTFKAILEEQRRNLAARYIAESHVAISEIAFLLGFSTLSAFGKAFRRWHRTSPLEHRLRFRGSR